MKFRLRSFVPFVAVFLLGLPGLAGAEDGLDPNLVDPAILPEEWDDETVDLFQRLVVLEERLKPVTTFATVKILKYRQIKGVRLKLKGGGKRDLSPAAWFLDCLFYPDAARQYPIFLVEDSDALEMIGLDLGKKKRERYTFDEINEAREELEEAARRYQEIPAKDRNAPQAMIVSLANNIIDFEYLISALDFAREGIPIYEGEDGESTPKTVPTSQFVREELEPMVQEIRQHGRIDNLPERLKEVADQFLMLARKAQGSLLGTNWFPPQKLDDPNWLSCGELLYETMQKVPVDEAEKAEYEAHRDWAAERLEAFEDLVALRDDREGFKAALQKFSEARTAEMEPRIEEAAKVAVVRKKNEESQSWQESQARQFAVSGAEVTYQNANFFQKAMFGMFLIFLCIAVTWLSPQATWSRRLRSVSFWLMLVPLLLLTIGIGYRVYIMGRPPVSELYETIPFITLVVIVVGMFMDKFFRMSFMLPLAAALGCLGLFLTHQYEVVEGADTMKELTAVLRSTFWLTTHVLTVLVGYSAGIVAAVISMIYIVGRLFDFKRKNKDFARGMTRAAYGIICFGLFFSLVGTILGGIWANDSWGRFWGWDPKENGALMIVLWFLMIMHARLGGYIKEFGLHNLSVLGGAVVVFSWFHTNQLGVGLHSYGFTSGVMLAIHTAYYIIFGVFLIGFVASIVAFAAKRDEKAKARAERTLASGEPGTA